MKYKELKIITDRAVSEAVQAALIEAGFDAMQIDDALDAKDIAEHPDVYKYDYINEEITAKAGEADSGEGSGSRISITLYFADDEDGSQQLGKAEALLAGLGAERVSYANPAGKDDPGADKPSPECGMGGLASIMYSVAETGDDSEWLYKWQEYFKPSKVGERIVVKPGWEDYEPADGDLVIEMDPGMAFGSGLHETTSMCVKALEKILSGSEDCGAERGLKVLDVGTGTGILAMAAVLLGAGEALGIDIDEEAIRVSEENIRRNGLCDRIRVMQGDLMKGIDFKPDIIVANLMADLVMMLSPAAASELAPGGIYITSGILDIKEETVKKAIADAGFDITEVLADGEWRAISAVRR